MVPGKPEPLCLPPIPDQQAREPEATGHPQATPACGREAGSKLWVPGPSLLAEVASWRKADQRGAGFSSQPAHDHMPRAKRK